MMSFLMVYVMILFNISLNIGGMTNQVFLLAFHEMIIMWPVAFFLELLVVDSLAHKLAFRFVQPTDRPIVITLAISCMIVCIMCPCTSLIATVLFKNSLFPDNIHELPCRIIIPDFLLWSSDPFLIWKNRT
jgi:hypothetical protein